MNPSAFSRVNNLPSEPKLSAAQIRSQAEAPALARLAKQKAIQRAEDDCRSKSYTEGGHGESFETKHYFDFFIEKDKSGYCSESIASADLWIEYEPGLFFYTKNTRYSPGKIIQRYEF